MGWFDLENLGSWWLAWLLGLIGVDFGGWVDG